MQQRNRRQLPVIILALVVAATTALGSTAADTHVLVVSIDGLMASSYDRASPARIPVLRRLAAAGAYAEGVVGVLPSVTYPSHTTLITGVTPSVHGIVDNHVFDPDGKLGGAFYWYGRDIRVPTLVDRVREHGGRTAAVSWPVTVGMNIDYHVPEFWRTASRSLRERAAFIRTVSTPHLIDTVERTSGAPIAEPQSDQNRLDMAAFILKSYQPDLTLVHFTGLDTAEHTFGPGSPQAFDTLARLDGYVGQLVNTVRAGSHADRTYIVVVSDHGFLPIERQLNPNALFRREGLISFDEQGRVISWRAAFHSSGGSGYVYLRDPADLALHDRVASLLETLHTDPVNGVDAVWTANDIAAMGGPPDAAFGLNMRPPFYTGEGHTALLTSTLRDADSGGMRGGHGFAPTRREMQSSLIVTGPALRGRGDLGTIRMTQIAPTLARWLGVTLSPLADSPIAQLGSSSIGAP